VHRLLLQRRLRVPYDHPGFSEWPIELYTGQICVGRLDGYGGLVVQVDDLNVCSRLALLRTLRNTNFIFDTRTSYTSHEEELWLFHEDGNGLTVKAKKKA